MARGLTAAMGGRRVAFTAGIVLAVAAAVCVGLRATGLVVAGPTELLSREMLHAYTPAEPDIPLEVLLAAHAQAEDAEVSLLIDKSDLTLQVLIGGEVVKTYPIALGTSSLDDKQRRDDRLTPEGEFYVCQRNLKPRSRAWDAVWMRLSYPNAEDARRGLQDGLITEEQARAIERAIAAGEIPPRETNLGSGIGIHAGGIEPRTWTQGCIALQRAHAEEIYRHTRPGTVVSIRK